MAAPGKLNWSFQANRKLDYFFPLHFRKRKDNPVRFAIAQEAAQPEKRIQLVYVR
jgi:hypothetical protein